MQIWFEHNTLYLPCLDTKSLSMIKFDVFRFF
jgi:hypothetical protein